MFYRQSHGRDGLSSARIASVIVMRRAHNPIDFSACMMSFRIFKKIGKQKKSETLMPISIVRFFLSLANFLTLCVHVFSFRFLWLGYGI